MNKIIAGFMVFSVGASSLSAAADARFYGGVSLGATDNQLQVSSSEIVSGQETKESLKNSGDSTSFSIRGGYQFHKNIAVEIGHYHYGEVTFSYMDDLDDAIENTVKTKSNNLGVRALWPITESISLNAVVGLAKWHFDVETTDSFLPGKVYESSENGTNLYYSAGIEYSFNTRFNIGLEYSSLSMKWDESELDGDDSYEADTEHKVNNLSLVARINF